MLSTLAVNNCIRMFSTGRGPAECLGRAVSPEEDWARARAMNLDVTGRAICVLRVLVVRRASRLNSTDAVVHAVAGQTQLVNSAVLQQTRI